MEDKETEIIFLQKQIEELKKELELLKGRENEKRASLMINAIPDMVFRLDKNGVYLDYKADVTDLYAQSVENIIGKNNRDITPPEFSKMVDEYIEKALSTGELQTFEYQLDVPNRGLRDYEARMIKSGTDEIIAVVRDLTEKKHYDKDLKNAFQQVRESEEKFRKLFEVVPIPLCYANMTTGEILMYNKIFENLLGYKLKDIPTLTDWFLKAYPEESYRNEVAEKWSELVREAKRDNTSVRAEEYVVTTKNGKKLTMQISGIFIDEYFLATFIDLTSRKEMENRLKETNENLEEMLYIASHDLQVPLISMEGYASELLEDYKTSLDENGVFCLTRLKTNASNMHRLVISLLDISRLNTQKKAYEQFNLKNLIEKILIDLSLHIEKKKATIQMREMPELYADKERIETVFRNLLSNALNYGGKNIEITWFDNMIYVKDDGIGIPQNQLDNIFKAGERLQMNESEGIGMGLAFCKKVIEKHNWEIRAESEGINKGSSFIIKYL